MALYNDSPAQDFTGVSTLSYTNELRFAPDASAYCVNPKRISEASTLSIGSRNMFPPEFGDDEFYYSSTGSSSTTTRAVLWANRLKRIITFTKLTRAFRSRRRGQETRGSSFIGGVYDANGKYLGLERHSPNQAFTHNSAEDKFY